VADLDARATLAEAEMEAQLRIVHWFDTTQRRIACGVPGWTNSTKHTRGVTCSACLALAAREVAGTSASPPGRGTVQ
jgi:hypothetical protein